MGREIELASDRFVGATVEVLVAGKSVRFDKQPAAPTPERTQLQGRTRGDHIVVFDGPERLIGHYVNVPIVSATALTLLGGEPVEID